MKVLLILTAIAFAADAKPSTGCTVGEWGPWGDWVESYNDKSGSSYPAPPRTAETSAKNRKNMDYIMHKFKDTQEQRRRCLADGTCPELAPMASQARTNCVSGKAGSYDCSNVDLLAHISNQDLWDGVANPNGNDIWGWVDPQNNDEYAIMGMVTGTVFVNITDPENPDVVAKVNDGRSSDWRDIKVINNYAFIISEALLTGVQTVDLSLLKEANNREQINAGKYNAVSRCHNIVADVASQHVYAVGCRNGNEPCSSGLHAIDVSTPGSPTFAGCFETDGYTHDAQCLTYNGPDTTYQGKEVCFAYNENTLTIVDVSNKTAMSQISRVTYTGVQYSHQGWLTENHEVLLLDDELDEDGDTDKRTRTYIFNVQDLANPVLQTTFYHASTSIDHNQYVVGDLSYQANYASGLRIMRIDEANFELTEVGFFDVSPAYSGATFNGAWGVYPFFPSGTIAISSIEEGLFLLRPDIAAMAQVSNKVQAKRERKREIIQLTDINACPPLSEHQYQ